MPAVLMAGAVSSAYASGAFGGRSALLPPLGLLICAGAGLGYRRATLANRLVVALGLLGVIATVGWGAYAAGAPVAAAVLWFSVSGLAMERLPLLFGLLTGAVMAGCLALPLRGDGPLVMGTAVAVLLSGRALRLDSRSRGARSRLFAQERAAREAEAVAAALTERAGVAREIHDILAHSLSAQLVHLEAARLLIEREPPGVFRDQLLERVATARGMAGEGLAETRRSLAVLRGELTTIEEYLREIAAAAGAATEVSGEPIRLTAEASQTVRGAAREALTRVREHAPDAAVRVHLGYEEGAVVLTVRDTGPPSGNAEVTDPGSGYGLRGVRERAELLGGALEAGPEGDGFVVRLRVPV
ncbi:sensor histidine kinase [Streptomyces sp. NPDC020965]|uniref:sensor histidine kinase n=1 Tax=Streptomyces sp. NPDC020965 TaxID=3365105 RepID=UPI003788F71E